MPYIVLSPGQAVLNKTDKVLRVPRYETDKDKKVFFRNLTFYHLAENIMFY